MSQKYLERRSLGLTVNIASDYVAGITASYENFIGLNVQAVLEGPDNVPGPIGTFSNLFYYELKNE